jgi:hypothetical protein
VPLEQLLVDVFENVLPSHEFEEREGQEFMAFHAGSIIKSESILIAEAGVGIGKTFAYLIPALLAFDWSSELIKKTLAISTNPSSGVSTRIGASPAASNTFRNARHLPI